ncbi:MAG TPA: YkgJ family cysteine cluster protein [Phycisphaerae bacterium]|nr:YkgJ family cysteine cluster protein [Phycisphaerae bacterium]
MGRLISRSRTPWYAAGLAFECVGCGRCCEGPAEGYVWVTGEEIAAIAAFLGIDEQEARRRYVRRVGRRWSLIERPDNRDCIFLTPPEADGARRCHIYPVRPSQCRTWPFWPGNIPSPQSWSQAGMRCPGINRGGRFSRDEIDAKAKATIP